MIERRLINFYTSRLFTFLLFVLVVLIFNALKESFTRGVIPVALSLLFYAIFNLVYYSIPQLKVKILPILIMDSIFISVIVFLTGGIKSNFHILYLILIVFAGFYLEKIELYFLATISMIGFSATIVITYLKQTKDIGLSGFYLISYPIAIYFVAVYTIAMIITRINTRVRRLKKELREKEKEIEEITRLKNKIVDTITSGIITTDDSLNITFINPQGMNFLRQIIPDKKIIGENLRNIFPVENFLKKLDFLDRYLIEVKNRLFGISIARLISNNEFKGFLIVFQDLTEIKKMERKAQFRDKMTELGELSASFAHEFRNSLASLKGAIQLLREEDRVDDELLSVIESEINRLSDEINDFLRFARRDFQKPQMQKFLPFVRRVVEEFKTKLSKDIDFRYYEDIDENECAYYESVRLKKVFNNILVNSLKAIAHSELKRINVRVYQRDEWIVFEVEDSGIGIKDSDKSKVFEPYFSGFSQGIGMGLALSKAFVEEIGGKIEFDSVEGEGTVFRVFLKKGEGNEKQDSNC